MAAQLDFEQINETLKAKLLEFLPRAGRLETRIPGVAVSRYDFETSPERCLCSPMVAYVAQGSKRAFYGEHETRYGVGQCVVLGVDAPGIFQIRDAAPEKPFLTISIKLDNQIISSLYNEIPAQPEFPCAIDSPVGVMEAGLDLLDAFRRMASLAAKPEQIPVLAPLLLREIHFHLLSSPLGGRLKQFNTSGTKGFQIRCAISWLRENFRSPLKVADMAARANMAPSTFNRYFRQATGLSPLQFQKRLRLHEAERLMLVENRDANQSAMLVGYESGSQFTREYKRLFGAPPRRDIASRRNG